MYTLSILVKETQFKYSLFIKKTIGCNHNHLFLGGNGHFWEVISINFGLYLFVTSNIIKYLGTQVTTHLVNK